ncbi:15218_t:CDS:2 [Dentiscutata erythropus]|uniref:15218_t:CDS:1 n=1 Tax=Dentiscutata erythropus TaxID=1348616 RepID=A0A9N9CP46_9GLOM|nr:15218_t:CDS:2 [Dentiscutata erythropus]
MLLYLTYRHEARQLIQSKEIGDLNGENILQRIQGLIENLPSIRQAAIVQVQKAQYKQKQLYDRKIQKITEFSIGDKVFDWNVVKLCTLAGQVILTPISIKLLKRYYNRQGINIRESTLN